MKSLLCGAMVSIFCLGMTTTARAHLSTDLPQPWVLASWDEVVGRVIREEGDSEGPKSFAMKPCGGVLILDQVNQRVLNLDPDGNFVGSIDLPAPTYDDLEIFDGQAILVLDRLGTRTLLVLDMGGALIAKVDLEGRGITNSGLITAMFPRPDGVWLEVENRYSVRVLDRQLQPAQRRIVLGRPTLANRSLHAKLDRRGGVSLSISEPNEPASKAPVTLAAPSPIRRIVWLDQDASGNVYIVLHEAEFSHKEPYPLVFEQYQLLMLNENLEELARRESPWVLTALDQRVEFRLGGEGELVQMAFSPQGVALMRFYMGWP